MKNWTDKINGYGVYFRFILPVLMAISAYLITDKLRSVEKKFDKMEISMSTYFTNHLAEHRVVSQEYFDSSKKLENRLACIETELRLLRK